MVCPVPVAAAPVLLLLCYLSFSDFEVSLIFQFVVSYEISVTYVTYVINVTDRMAADSKT